MKRKRPSPDRPDHTDRPKKKRFARIGRPSEQRAKTSPLFDESDRLTLTFTAKGQTYGRHRQPFPARRRDTNKNKPDSGTK